MGRIRPENSRLFMVPGVIMILLAILLGYSLWRTWN